MNPEPNKQPSPIVMSILDVTLFALIIIPRLLFFSPQIDSWDSVDFALGLHSFDLTLYQPHFPGYPVLLFFAKLFSLMGSSDAVALSLPGLLGLSISLIVLRRSLTSCYSYQVGFSAALVLSSLPIVMLFSVRPMSDALGLAFLLATFSAGLSGRWSWLGFLLALSLGVRLSYAPLALSVLFLLWRRSLNNKRDVLVGFLLGVSLWLVPLVLMQGFTSLVNEGLRFVTGHLTRWGGAIDEDTDWGRRAQMLLWNLWAYGFGGLWPKDGVSFWRALATLSTITSLIGVVLTLRERRARIVFFSLLLPYGLWVCLGQNPESPRHFIPVIVLLAGAAAISLRYVSIVCAVGFFCVSLPLLKEQQGVSSPQAALAQFVTQNFSEARFYGWKTTRVVKYYAPQIETRLMRSLPGLVQDLEKNPVGGVVLFESKLTEKRRRDRCFEVVESFRRSRYVEPAYASLTLFRDCGDQ
jgi:hypothetical protein